MVHLIGFDLATLARSRNMWFSIVSQASTATSNQTTKPGHCVWYGQCHKDARGYQYCPYNGTAKPLAADGVAILKEWCPQFFETLNSAKDTCCDVEQLKTLDKNIKLAANFLKRCPSCMNNLAKHLCHFTCSPTQSDFMNATIKEETKDNKTEEYVAMIDLYIKTDYLEGKSIWKFEVMFFLKG